MLGEGGEGSVLQTSWSAHAHVRWLKKLGSCADIKKGRRRCPNLPIPLKNSNLFNLHSNFTEIMRLNPPPPKLKFNQSL